MIRTPDAAGGRPTRVPEPGPDGVSRFRGVVGATLVAGSLLVASALALNVLLQNLTASRALVFRTSTVLRLASDLHLDVKAAETGQRGYLLTGERRYLAPYEGAVGRIWSNYEALAREVRDPSQRDRLVRMRPVIEAKLGELAQTVALREEGLEEALKVVRTDLGQRLTEEIDGILGEFEREEQRNLLQGTAALERSNALATGVAGLTGLLALFTALVGALWLSRQRTEAELFSAERRFRRDLEGQVEERTRELTRSNEELDAFAYTVSHDLRAPLRAMHGYADALAEDYGATLPEEGRGFLARITAAAERMEHLIQDILTYSRLVRAEAVVGPTDLGALVRQAIAVREPDIARTGAGVRAIDPFPDVRAHGPTLAQALDNLLANALKFVASGRAPEVTIRAERREAMVRVWVEDRGIGIAPEHRERIFRPFERLHGVEAYPGTGIGLAIVRRSVERMGGASGVESEPGSGSRFWIELPAAEDAR